MAKRNRYREMENLMTRVIIGDALVFALYQHCANSHTNRRRLRVTGRNLLDRSEGDHRHYRHSWFPFMPWLAGHHRRVFPPPESVDGNGLYRNCSVRAGVPASGLSRSRAYGVTYI